jgi:hypothetical protein
MRLTHTYPSAPPPPTKSVRWRPDSAVIEVGPATPGPLVVGTDSDPVLNASDAGIKARLKTQDGR